MNNKYMFKMQKYSLLFFCIIVCERWKGFFLLRGQENSFLQSLFTPTKATRFEMEGKRIQHIEESEPNVCTPFLPLPPS